MYKRMLVLRFPSDITDKPIVCSLSREYNLCFNILKATILPGHEGIMILELSGHRKNVQKGLTYLRDQGVKVKSVAQEITRNEELCFMCGACTGVCPTNALYIDKETMEVVFDPDNCKGCGLCVAVCPVRAMEIRFAAEKLLS